ncbi:MAG: carbohydrate ABC transporter permease, partial [Burkholderiales bacterium]
MQRLKNIGGRIGHFGIIAAFTVFCAFPFYWMLITTFKQTNDLINVKNNPFLYNSPPTLENLRILFSDT